VYSNVLFWFMAVLTLLLVVFVGAVFTTRTVTVRSPGPSPPRLIGRPQHAAIAGGGAGSARAGYRPQHAGTSVRPGGRAGAHRQVRRHGAHRAGLSTGRERRSPARSDRHRAGAH
jgi:hypothetical protein